MSHLLLEKSRIFYYPSYHHPSHQKDDRGKGIVLRLEFLVWFLAYIPPVLVKKAFTASLRSQ